MELKKSWKIIMAVLGFAAALCLAYYFLETRFKVEPSALLEEALDNTLKTKSFRYKVNINLISEDDRKLLSDIQGEKASNGDYHLEGTMDGDRIEVYKTGNTTYIRGGEGKTWMKIPGDDILKQELYMLELNPLGSFNITSANSIKYKGIKKLNGRKCFVLDVCPEIDNEFLETYFKDFTYQLFIDREHRRIVRADIEAANKKDSSKKVEVKVELTGFGDPIKIKTPAD